MRAGRPGRWGEPARARGAWDSASPTPTPPPLRGQWEVILWMWCLELLGPRLGGGCGRGGCGRGGAAAHVTLLPRGVLSCNPGTEADGTMERWDPWAEEGTKRNQSWRSWPWG